jgi:hypothetical protein
MDGDDDCGAISGMNDWQGNPKYSEETCPVPLQVTHDLPQSRTRDTTVRKPVANHLSYGTALFSI